MARNPTAGWRERRELEPLSREAGGSRGERQVQWQGRRVHISRHVRVVVHCKCSARVTTLGRMDWRTTYLIASERHRERARGAQAVHLMYVAALPERAAELHDAESRRARGSARQIRASAWLESPILATDAGFQLVDPDRPSAQMGQDRGRVRRQRTR